MRASPRVDIPDFPDGYVSELSGRHLEWTTVEGWLTGALHYWLATTRPDGRPHVVPRWGVWLDGAFWYDGSPDTRHARNLATNPNCTLHLESGEQVAILEGRSTASRPISGAIGDRLAAEFASKYQPAYTPAPDAWSDENAGGMRQLVPDKAIAWSSFPTDVTRFTFEPVKIIR